MIDHETYVNYLRTGYSGYTPTLSQLGTVPKNVTVARYQQVNKLVTVYFELIVTGAGGTGGNIIKMTNPVAARNSGMNVFCGIGTGAIYKASTGIVYQAIIHFFDVNTVVFNTTKTGQVNGTQYLGVVDFTPAFLAGDVISGSFSYEAA